jgi:hypothetical protein
MWEHLWEHFKVACNAETNRGIPHVTTRGARSLTRARRDARGSKSMDGPTKISAEHISQVALVACLLAAGKSSPQSGHDEIVCGKVPALGIRVHVLGDYRNVLPVHRTLGRAEEHVVHRVNDTLDVTVLKH